MNSHIKVLIQAEAGSTRKVQYDEKALKPIREGKVSRPYPYPYGFVIGTTAADGDNIDCYVLSEYVLRTGVVVECEVVGLLQQTESGESDHKVLAVVAGREAVIPAGALGILEDFIYGIFSEYPESVVSVGPIRSRDDAVRYVNASRDV